MSAWEAAGDSDEWFTPAFIFEALGVTFDLDVASPEDRTFCHVPADRFLTANALTAPWAGFVWMNPPFGGRGDKSAWLNRFFDHGNGIALTPDRTSAPWFQAAWRRAEVVAFLPKVKFIKPDGTIGKQPGNGTCLWAAGERAIAALDRAERAGICITANVRWLTT